MTRRKIHGRMIKLTHADRLARDERYKRRGTTHAVRVWARQHILKEK